MTRTTLGTEGCSETPPDEVSVESGVRFLYVTMVPAPKCESCGTRTVRASSVAWVCEKCGDTLSAPDLGVYPVQDRE